MLQIAREAREKEEPRSRSQRLIPQGAMPGFLQSRICLGSSKAEIPMKRANLQQFRKHLAFRNLTYFQKQQLPLDELQNSHSQR